MADSTPTVSTEVGADREPVASDEIGGKHHQKVKVEFGADDSATQVSLLDPLPVEEQSPLDLSGLATQATLAALLTELADKVESGDLATLEDKDYATQATLAALLTELGQKLEVSDLAGLATQTTAAAIRDRLPAALDNGSLNVADVFGGGESLADQAGAGGVLTFTFASPVDLIWVRSVGGVSRADPFGGTPSVSAGIWCADDEPTPITVRATAVEVFAPAASTVAVWGFRS